METLFWVAALVTGYVYAGYPLLLALWARVAARPVRKRASDDLGPWPAISVVVAARNEAARLPARLANLLELTYPGPREIIVVSDGSTDDTADVLRPFAGQVRVIEVPAGGKPLALNAGVAAAAGEILVFADARQRFQHDALVQLVANFADPSVGGVTGELVLDCEASPAAAESTIADGVGAYWKYEKWLRRNEGLVRSTLGATGAIYALRRVRQRVA
jgi:cellulose synthase/poly-beta-1,6-N-acetylglucosamine synthase-like glycosyltransferase